MEYEVSETHLGFIQSTINRMSQNSFQAKAWCITVVTALNAFLFSKGDVLDNNIAIVVGIVVTLLFYLLDSYYLYLERGYRCLYNEAAGLVEGVHVAQFCMEIPNEKRGFKCFSNALTSVSTWLFYLGVLCGLVIVAILV